MHISGISLQKDPDRILHEAKCEAWILLGTIRCWRFVGYFPNRAGDWVWNHPEREKSTKLNIVEDLKSTMVLGLHPVFPVNAPFPYSWNDNVYFVPLCIGSL